MVKNLPTMRETWDRSLGLEDPLEKEMENRSRTLAHGKPHGQRSLVGYRPRGRKESDTAEQLHFHFLQISKCLSLPTGTQGRSGGLNEAYFLQRKKKKGTQKDFCPVRAPLGPSGFQDVGS